MRRRTFLATVGAAGGAAMAGCGGAGEGPGSQDDDAGRVIGGESGTESPDAASTPDEPATPDETTTTTETTDTETSTDEETSTEGPSTPGAAGDAEEGSMEYPGEYVDVRDVEYHANEDADRGPTVTGDVQNVSTETLSLVEAKVWAYDEDDEEVGEALDDTTDLGPGETWEFECELWDTDAGAVDSWEGRVDVSTY